ncbi:MAG: exonuclease domain-containing protein [Anaerolineae bacterium]|nr:exonuclease domain-containing protein [Anaerolineae bacterium]
MAKKLDQILVVDLESTCWAGDPPPGEEHEIIEIGLCVLDVATGRRLDNRSILICPTCSRISDYCRELTTLTQNEVEAGVTLAEACRALRENFGARRRPWASWGDYDRKQLQRECQAKSVEYPFGDRHINAKTLFALVRGLKREVGLDSALDMLGFPLEGTHHRGGDDAWNIARILAWLLAAARTGGEAALAHNPNPE